MRTLIVGDVHGCLSELQDLIAETRLSKKSDALVFVGDLVSKGPDSHGVLKLAREWNAKAAKGNHDAHLLEVRRGNETRKKHVEVAKSLDEDDWRFLEAMPLWVRLPGMIVVHGGLVPGIPLEQQEEEALLNMRSLIPDGKWSKKIENGVPWASLWTGPERVVFGHDAMRGLQRWPHALGLDSGCVYGKKLTGLLLPDDVLVSVPARQQWAAIDGLHLAEQPGSRSGK